MAFGLLNNKEWKMDLKWNAECDEIETGNQNKMEKEYGLE